MPFIRDFHADDINAVAAIYAEAVTNGAGSYEIDPPSVEEMQRRFEALAQQGFPRLVAEEEGRVLGYAYVGYYHTRAAYRWAAEDSIYVDAQARGKGVGKLLLQELIRRVEALGFRQIVAVIGDGERNAGSVGLHESAGFIHCGRINGSGFKHGRWLDTVLMQLPLNGGTATSPDAPPFA